MNRLHTHTTFEPGKYRIHLSRKTLNLYVNRLLIPLLFIMLSGTSMLLAEGTKQTTPTTTAATALLLAPSIGTGPYFNAPEANRVYFSINNATTEDFYFGFDFRNFTTASGTTKPSTQANMYYRILNPDGSVAVGPTLWSASGPGKIDTYAQAVAGPNISGSVPAGYSPLVFDPTVVGEHWIEVWQGTSTTDFTPVSSTERTISALFDLTVANKTAPYAVKPGRVFSYKWGFAAVDPTTFRVAILGDATPALFAYTEDQLILKVEFSPGFKPLSFDLGVNEYGASNTGDRIADRRSRNELSGSPAIIGGYRVFLNPADEVVYPRSPSPVNPSFQTPVFSGCNPPYGVNIIIPEPGDVKILLDLNGTTGYQSGTEDRYLEAFDLPSGNNTISWDGKDGLGGLVSNSVPLNMKLIYLKGRFNLPLYDVEMNIGGLSVTTISPAGTPTPKLFWDDSHLTSVGRCDDSGDNQNNNTGSGTDNSLVGIAAPAHAWNGNGNPTNTIPAPGVNGNDMSSLQCDDFGNVRTINTWGWGLEKDVSTIAVLGCPDVTIAKTVNTATPAVGDTVTFIVTASNAGPPLAPNVVVKDVLPSGYSLISAVPSVGTWSAPNWNVGTLTVGAMPTLTLKAKVLCTGLYTNIATISSTQSDSNPNNNTAYAVVTPKSTGEINLTNTCPATTVNLTTQAPCNGPTGTQLTWHTGPIATANNKIADPTGVGAGVYYAAFEDPVTHCYSPTTAFNVTISLCADLGITKTDGSLTYTPGASLAYSITATNNGPSNVTGATVNDILPAILTNVSWSSTTSGIASVTTGASGTGNTLAAIVNMNSGSSVTFTVTGTVQQSATGNLVNTATIEVPSGVIDINLGNNSATDTDTPAPRADLSVTKTDGSATYMAGTTTTYTVVVSNIGPSDVVGAVVRDTLPTGTTWSYTSTGTAGTSGNSASGTATINDLVTIPSGGSITYTVVVMIPSGFTGNLTNRAYVLAPAGTTDPTLANNSATDTDTPNSLTDLSIIKTVNDSVPLVNSEVVFTIRVSNHGPSDASGVTVTDILPTGYTYISDDGGFPFVSSTGIGSVGNLASGASDSIKLTVKVNAVGVYLNTTTVSGQENDPVPGNNTSSRITIPQVKIDAVNDTVPSVTSGNSVTYPLLSNDTLNGVGGIAVALVNSTITDLPAKGTASINIATGEIVYTPQVGESGTDSLRYKICDVLNPTVCDSAWVFFTIDPLIVGSYDFMGVVVADSSLTFAVLLNDSLNQVSPIDTTLVSVSLLQNGLKGVGLLGPAGILTYTAGTGQSGFDSLVYEICDKINPTVCDTALVVVRIEDPLLLLPKVYLQGALLGVTYSDSPTNTIIDSLMRDDLRVKGLIPLTSPYGYLNPTISNNTISASVLSITGANAIVDWVFVELRNSLDSTVILSGRSALLQRDGDIVALDGTSPLEVRALNGTSYFITIRHRNHLAVMTKTSLPLSTTGTVVDFRMPTTLTYTFSPAITNQSQVSVLQGSAMWAGNALSDKEIIYQGTKNDVNVIVQQVLSASLNTFKDPNFILRGYFTGDINMNGEVIFQGTRNDPEFIYQNIIKNHPGNIFKDFNFIIRQQLPE